MNTEDEVRERLLFEEHCAKEGWDPNEGGGQPWLAWLARAHRSRTLHPEQTAMLMLASGYLMHDLPRTSVLVAELALLLATEEDKPNLESGLRTARRYAEERIQQLLNEQK